MRSVRVQHKYWRSYLRKIVFHVSRKITVVGFVEKCICFIMNNELVMTELAFKTDKEKQFYNI